ncbi:PAS domain S-box protein [Anaerobacillus sp. CMMVII]|uniref:ATP-binding protein n=1 Tax=Anaerobacillus sp. CMMVII TaxID=2755588 RepID=UPI0021B70F83|nr:ATP-binding protein [Anaerobacillus sp. CMMVII]MCT8139341.1 PAS domain S-box protein [Anaerobacillus sp. CMMVII]
MNSSKEQEEKLTTLINSMVDFVNFKDGEGRWIKANDFGLKLFQLENVDYHGKKDSELARYTDFYREALLHCESSDEQTWQNGKITRCEEEIPIPDGSTKYFDTIKVPLFNEDGTRKALVVIGRDITDKKIAEEQVRRSEKLSIVGELAASVGHEIRNPLTSIKGFLQLLKEQNKENNTYYDIMCKELNRIDHIVGELLLLAKPQKVFFSKNDLNIIVSDIVSLLEPQANMNNIRIRFEQKENVMIECEENLLKQLFINLIKNAIEASNEKGNVWVNINKNSNEDVFVTVEDEGLGISEEILTKLGEPFYSSKEKGTGLGLTVSSKIVEQHGGTISFYSKEGIGTKVEVHLPINSKKRR